MSSKKKSKKEVPSGKLQVSVKQEISAEWNTESTNRLLSRMVSNLSKPDTLKYSSMLDKMPWDKVAFGDYTVDDCKNKWNTISREVRKFRTLTEVLTDVKEYIRDPYKGQIKKHPDYPKRPLTPYFQFFMEKRDQFASKHKQMSNLEVTAELSKKYRELPSSKKEKYILKWKEQTGNFRIEMKKFKEEHPDYFNTNSTRPNEPRIPGTIYKDEHLEEFGKLHPDMTKKEWIESLKKQYKQLPDDEKQKYIEKSLSEQKTYKVALKNYFQHNPDVSKAKSGKVYLNKYERKLNDKHIGKPLKPPSNGYNLFCTETMPTLTSMLSQNRIVECGRIWKQMSDEQKKGYHRRYLAMKKQYEENYEKFCENMTSEQKEMEFDQVKVKKEIEPVKGKKSPKGKGSPSKRIKTERRGSSSEEESSSDEDDDLELNDTSDDNDSDDSDEEEDEDEEEEEEEESKENESEDNKDFQRLAPARPTTPISALFLYQKAHRKKVEAQYPGMSADEITRLLARRYHELPEHKRHKYAQKEKEQRALYNEKMQQYLKEGMKKNGVDEPIDAPKQPEPVTGEQLYHEKVMPLYTKKFPNSKQEMEQGMRTAWSKLNKARREPFIKQAQILNEQNIAAYRVAMETATNTTEKVEDKSQVGAEKVKPAVVSKKKIKFEGEPKKPPLSGYQLFSATHLHSLSHFSQNEKFKEIGRMWKELDAAKKKTFVDEAKKGNEKYKKELDIWLKQQPKEVAEQYKAQQSNKRAKTTDRPVAKKPKLDENKAATKVDKNASDDSDSSDSGDESSSSEEESDSSSSDSSDSDSDDESSSDSDDSCTSADSE